MLQALAIENVALIERLELGFGPGLVVLTGETGAGKSILLDSLGLALGARADAGLVAPGAERARVTAIFAPDAVERVTGICDEAEVRIEPGEPLILRRTLGNDGRSRAFVNDQPVSVGLLRRLGDALVEIQGQFDRHGLLDPRTHRSLLDRFGGLEKRVTAVAAAHAAWKRAEADLGAARERAEAGARDREFLEHAVQELDALAPEEDEEAELEVHRTFLAGRERIVEALGAAEGALGGEVDVAAAIASASRALERVADRAEGRLDAAIAALERAAIELGEAQSELAAAAAGVEAGADELERVEDRIHALRDVARKHRVNPDDLPALHARLRAELDAIENQGESLDVLSRHAAEARETYVREATALGEARREAAVRLATAVEAELSPLRLERARFRASLEPLDEWDWSSTGCERVTFEVATNPGAPLGQIARIASGGELARFMLALAVVLSATGGVATIVFDEVDAGIGGATAAAVGERLARLATTVQVLVVTHSPQVAARGMRHFRVDKRLDGGERASTHVAELPEAHRREEIARMLSGSAVTEAARAAADDLLGADG